MSTPEEEKKPIKIYGNPELSSRINQFQEQAEKHKEKQLSNPFSGWAGEARRKHLQRGDSQYGTPPEGSKTEERGKKAADLVSNEIEFLCDMIRQHGQQQEDGTFQIIFKELFEMYKVISNKLVGILLRARKHGLLQFEGEMLYQGRDNDVVITLLNKETTDN